MKTRITALLILALASWPAFADSNHECQGNSCNGSGPVTNTAVSASSAESKASASNVVGVTTSVKNSNTNVNVSEGGKATAKSYSGGNVQSVTVTDSGKREYSGGYTVKNVPNPPDVIANPTAPCRIAFSGSGSGAGFGIGIGGSVLDEGCDLRERVRLLYNMGLTSSAVQLFCTDKQVAQVIPSCVANEPTPAPAPGAQAPTPIKESAAWNGSTSIVAGN